MVVKCPNHNHQLPATATRVLTERSQSLWTGLASRHFRHSPEAVLTVTKVVGIHFEKRQPWFSNPVFFLLCC